MDWLSLVLEGLTALFTGAALIWNYAYRTRPKWQPYVVEATGSNESARFVVRIVNIGNGTATDVRATTNHPADYSQNSTWKHYSPAVASGGSVYARILVQEEKEPHDSGYIVRYIPPQDGTISISWHQQPFLGRKRTKTWPLKEIPRDYSQGE